MPIPPPHVELMTAPPPPQSLIGQAPPLPPPVYARQQQPPPFMDPAIVSLGGQTPVSAASGGPPPAVIPPNYADESSDESSVDATPYSVQREFTPPVKSKRKDANSSPKKHRALRPVNGTSNSRKNQNNRHNYTNSAAESDGWATENVTDIRDTEFDFQANLDLFDKASVFNQIRENDTIDPGNRLVAFNKKDQQPLPAPPLPHHHHHKHRQEKYGNLEMVIQSDTNWLENEFEDEDEDENENVNVNESANQNGRRNRKTASDNNNNNSITRGRSDTNNNSPVKSSIPIHVQQGMSNVSVSDTTTASNSSSIQQLRKASTSAAPTRKSFIASNTLKQCPCASPVQMVQLERICSETFGLSQLIINENAGRGVAQLAIKALGGISRFNFKNHNSRPLIVVLAGNNESGTRALVAARHLANRQVQVIAVVPGGVNNNNNNNNGNGNGGSSKSNGNNNNGINSSLDSSIIASSIKAFESSGGKVITRLEQLTPLINTYESPVELIIDGLQGYQSNFEDMWEEETVTTALSLIEWANRHKASVMSLDIPSGLDSSTGLPTNDNQFIKSKWVISLGFPLTGTLNAHLAEIVSPNEWTCYIVDVGFPKAALRASGMRRFEKLWFGSEWSIELSLADN